MSIKPRPCRVKFSTENKDGTFHQFGTYVSHQDDGRAIGVTVAIVELSNGNVIECEPHKLTFTDV